MIGINVDMFNSIINRAIDSEDSYKSNSKGLSNAIDTLEYCYDGNFIGYLFNEPIDKKNELKNIDKVIQNDIEILNDVKNSYIKQNQIFKNQIDHINSNIQ